MPNSRLEFRGEDWRELCTPAGLKSLIGISNDLCLLKLVVKELVDNALDENYACDLYPRKWGFVIQDYGKGITGTDEEIADLFSVNRTSLSSKGTRKPTRGAIGNGLRVVVGIILRLNITQIKVATRGRALILTPNSKDGKTKYKAVPVKTEGTRIEIYLTMALVKKYSQEKRKTILEWGQKAIEMARGERYKGKSSPYWFDTASFHDFLTKANLSQDNTLKNILIKAFGIHLKSDGDTAIEKLLSSDKKLLSLDPDDSKKLLVMLRNNAEKIAPDSLGQVGPIDGYLYEKESAVRTDGDELKAQIPYLVEVWGKTSNKNEMSVYINKTPIAQEHEVVLVEHANKIWFENCSLCIIEHIKLASPIDLRINIITPFIPSENKAKRPDLRVFEPTIGNVVKTVITKVNSKYMKGKSASSKKASYKLLIPEEIRETFESIRNKSDNGGFLAIKKLAEETDKKTDELIVLSKDHDPFYVGKAKDLLARDWFILWWIKLGYHEQKKPVHLRRMHYKLQSIEEKIIMPNGGVYENNTKSWHFLLSASRCARLTGALDPELIIDMRNPEARIYTSSDELLPTALNVNFKEWSLPEISTTLSYDANWALPHYDIAGYEYKHQLQPHNIEIWCEKSTMDDILIPICEEFNLIYIAGMGYTSMTRIIEFIKRIETYRKPTRIFYISDFDPAGANMPVAAARQIEFWMDKKGLKSIDVRLENFILTKEQVAEYNLPRKKIKVTDRGRENFEDLHGTGSVELDALEAIHPGELDRLVRERIYDFYDISLEPRINSNKATADLEINNLCKKRLRQYKERIEDIKIKLNEVVSKYEPELNRINDLLSGDIGPLKKDLEQVRSEVQGEVEKMQSEITLPALPKATVIKKIDKVCLYDSCKGRDLQLQAYKEYKPNKSKKSRKK